MPKKKVTITQPRNLPLFIVTLLIPQLAGGIGAIFTTPNISQWYVFLHKPFFAPPNWVFAPVWTTLFLLMGVALYLIWNAKKSQEKNEALLFFFVQLMLNILWSVLFFGLRSPLAAFLEILVLWVLILLTIFHFFKVSKVAGWLLVPYLLWVSFASVLNWGIVLVN